MTESNQENDNSEQDQESTDHVEELKSDLYSNSKDISGHREAELQKERHEGADGWAGDQQDLDDIRKENSGGSSSSWLNMFLLISMGFFAVAFGYAYMTFVGGGGVSPEKIDISVSGPVSVTAGSVADFEIRVRNNNEVPLEEVQLAAVYPENTRSSEDVSAVQQRERMSLETISPGEEKQRQIQARLLGKKGTAKTVELLLEYKVPNSNAVYQKRRNYSVEIDSIPVSLSVEGPDTINSGNTAEFVATLQSNSDETVEDLVLSLTYPFGFEFETADPMPDSQDTTWRIDAIEPGETQEIRFEGRMVGEENEQRAVKFALGVADPGDSNAIRGQLAAFTQNVNIGTPFLGLSVQTNGQVADEYVANGGSGIDVNIGWNNNLSTRLANANITAEMTGGPYQDGSVRSGNGIYRASEKTVSWNQRNNNELGSIAAGGGGSVDFQFSVEDTKSIVQRMHNPTITFDVRMEAERIGETQQQVPTNVISRTSKSVKIATDAEITARLLHSQGFFNNTGPIPPEVGRETTYTVELSVSNTVNRVTDSVVTAQLPGYVNYKQVTRPSDAAVEFNPVSGELRWEVGTIPAGAGHTDPARTLAFKIGLTPASSQRESTPPLVNNIELTGTDNFVRRDVRGAIDEIDTELDEEGSESDDARVR